MLILLPPSEGKAVGGRGRPLAPDQLSFPELDPTRQAVLDALIATSGRDDALDVLRAPAGAAAQVAANVALRSAAARRVADLYTGVLYDALDLASLDPAARRRAGRRLVVINALFGALRPGDRVPPYRLSMDVDLPGVGRLAAAWREPLDEVLPTAAGRGLIVDMRSSTYVAAWRPSGPLAERTVAVHVVRETDRGRAAVSHMAKHTRGLVTRCLLAEDIDPPTPEDLADAFGAHYHVMLDEARPDRVRRLDVVEPT